MIPPTQLAELWTRHAAGLRLLARMRGGNADDLVQEAFVTLSGQATLPDDPLAWLARVIRNIAVSEIRADSRRRNREMRHASCHPKWFEDGNEHPCAVAPEQVESALQQLDSLLRELVVAIVWNGMTFRQVAEVFDLTPATAHRRYVEALSSLRTILLNSEPEANGSGGTSQHTVSKDDE